MTRVIKIIDKDPRAHRRRPKLWECFSKIGINPTGIKDAKGAYIAIVQGGMVEKMLTEESKTIFMREGFDIITPIEFNAMRSIVVRHIDKVINEYSDEEIISSIEERNSWAKVESIYKITNTGRLLKIRFHSTTMVKRALEEGLVVLHQHIPPDKSKRKCT